MPGPALIVVDVQQAFDLAPETFGGQRDNPDCEKNVARLVAAWRGAGLPVVFVRHDSVGEDSPLRPDRPGNAFKDVLTGEPDLIVAKQVNSAFIGEPDLADWLHARAIDRITVCGISTNHCCETTARMGANLGFGVDFVLDATHTFDRVALDGQVISAAVLARVTAANLNGEFADVVTTADAVRLLGAPATARP